MFLRLIKNIVNKICFINNTTGKPAVCQLLEDRPQINKLLNGHDGLTRWLVGQFSGKATNFPIVWDPNEPEDGSKAECCFPQENEPAKIRVSRNMCGRDQLAALIYELFNIRNCNKAEQIHIKACKGKLEREEYIRQNYRLEYNALRRCRKFIKKKALAFFDSENTNRLYDIYMYKWSFKEFYRASVEKKEGEVHFANFYDKAILPYLIKKQNNRNNQE